MPTIQESTTVIAIYELSKRFEQVQALDRVSFTLAQGELCGLLGANGAGKSTLFKTLMGLLQADSGNIVIADKPINFGEVEYKRQIGYSPESPVFYEYLTGLEFLNFIAAAKQLPTSRQQRATGLEEQIQHWLTFFDLSTKTHELIKNYSHGMRRKLSLIAALLGAPQLLLLDEATNGLDPETSFRFKEYLREYCRDGGTVLFSSHIIETVEHLCDRIIILHRGRVLQEMRREEWEQLRKDGSSLEQKFIALVQENV